MKRKIYNLLLKTKQVLLALALSLFSGTVLSQTTFTFNYTGTTQTLNVQAGTYSIACWGGDGYTQTSGFNGKGGFATGILTLTSPQIIYINVGGLGSYPSTGVTPNAWTFNGGGIGYPANNVLYGNGGGASDVRTVGGTWDNPASLAGRVIVAGGGGAGRNASYIGGNGGGLTGATGTYFSPDQAGGPTGGSQTAGGANTGYTSGLTQATLGLAMTWNGNALTANFLAGGGGGYYGGGSGRVAGGGGSSYIGGVSSGTTIMFGQSGFVPNPNTTGNGHVIITRLCNINLGTTTSISSVCQGAAVTLTTDAISSYTWSTGSNASSITVNPAVTTTYSLTAMSPSNCITGAAITITVSAAAPALTVSTSTNSICLGNTVNITASGALSYSISGGVTNAVSFTPVATTAYTVQGQNGCGTSSAVTTISVSSLPVVAITSTNVVCAGSTATLSGGGATTYTWLPGNLVGSSVLVSPQSSTTYTLLGFTGLCGGIGTVAVATNPVPSLTVTVSNFTICAGESSTLSATGASSYTWTPGGVGSSIVVNPLVPTSYIVVGENSFGCTSSAQQGVVAYAGPNMNIAASTTLLCAGSVVTLNSNGATTYNWSNGATTAITTATPASTTVYTVVGSSPGNPCSTTKTIEITVFTATMSVSNPTTICLGESVNLSASGADTYNWSNGGSGSSINVSPAATTVYTVNGITATGSGTCGSTATTTVTVNPLPAVLASSSRTNICRGESTNINASGATTYSWNTGSSSASIAVNPTVQTTYTVEGIDANGCKNTSSILIRVFTCLGLQEDAGQFNGISLYPNPSSGAFTIRSEETMELNLINELGQVVREIQLSAENAYTVEVNDLAKGIYFLNAKNTSIPFSKKIVVE